MCIRHTMRDMRLCVCIEDCIGYRSRADSVAYMQYPLRNVESTSGKGCVPLLASGVVFRNSPGPSTQSVGARRRSDWPNRARPPAARLARQGKNHPSELGRQSVQSDRLSVMR